MTASRQDEIVTEAGPVDMVLFCPKCGLQHVDAPDARTPDWTNPPHRSHLCHDCGCIWRPADVPTNGVAAIETQGRADTWVVPNPQAMPAAGQERVDDDALIEENCQPHCCCCDNYEPCCDCGEIMPGKACIGEKCWCGSPASKKVGEEILFDDPDPARHNLTAYVCARHYAEIMGPLGAKQVGIANRLQAKAPETD